MYITCLAYSLNSGELTSLSATAMAAIAFSWGPPWMEGNTAKFTFDSKSSATPSTFQMVR